MQNETSKNRKSIQDLIKKFEGNDGKKEIQKSQRVDLINNLNSLPTNKQVDLNENQQTKSLNVDRVKKAEQPLSTEITNLKIEKDNYNKTNTSYNFVKHQRLNEDFENNGNIKRKEINHEEEICEWNPTRRKSSIQLIKPSSFSNKKYNEPFKHLEINDEKEICVWNPSRRKSSVQLIKPSSFSNKKHNEQNDTCMEEEILEQNPIQLPERFTGPIYESRRSSFSSIKPSEIWDNDELPNLKRRNSRIIDEKIQTMRKKSIVIAEENEESETNEIQKTMSLWVKKPNNSLFQNKPSNVKKVEATNKTNRFSINNVQSQLLKWCQQQTKNYSNVDIRNFSSSWADGLAFCALIHNFLPNSFDYYQLNADNRRQNFEIAFEIAEKHAGITPLIEVDDMIIMGNKPDSKCIFTYVSTIYTRFVKTKANT